jgi:DNA-binding response OmpR family regulator
MAIRVLVVDDDEDARMLLARALARGGLAVEVDAAIDGHDALECIARRIPQAVITDIMMPRMNGFELCRALRAAPPTAAIPVLIVSALEDEADRTRGLAAGADDYLVKPISADDLASRLAALLDRMALPEPHR